MQKGTQRWTLLAKAQGSVEASEMKYGPTNMAFVDSWLEEIAKDTYAIVVTADLESEGGWGPEVDDPGGHEHRIEMKWFAIEGDALREVLAESSGGSSQLDYSGEFVKDSITVTSRVTSGYFNLELTSETTLWDGEQWGIHDPKVESSTSELRWDPQSRVYQ